MTNFLDTLSLLILLTSFILIANKRIGSYVRTFRLQSLLIALGAGIIGLESFVQEGRLDALILCVIMVLIKVIYIPNLLNKTYENVEHTVEKDFFLNIPILLFVSFLLFVFSYFTFSSIEGLHEGKVNLQMINLVSVVLIGLFFMITRKKAIGQIVGFLVLENGIFATAMFVTKGMPLIVDLGIFIDLLTGVLIMGLMVFRIYNKFDSIDINKMKNLRG
jgi:hydrogenase-4 component E